MSSLKAFTILRPLDHGTHGRVLLAQRKSDNKLFAIKVTNASNELQAFQYLEEMLHARNLQHPAIISCETCFTDHMENFGTRIKVACMVMEFADGGNLKEMIEQRRSNRKPFSEAEILDACCSVLEGLQYAYVEHGIAHRDIKPANILFSAGKLKIADFGECKRLEETLTHSIRGTPLYMAPEIWTQYTQQEVKAHYGPKSDIFSVGLVALDMATLEQGTRRDHSTLQTRIVMVGETYSRDFASWLSACLEQDYDVRISLDEALHRAMACKNAITMMPSASHFGSDQQTNANPPLESDTMASTTASTTTMMISSGSAATPQSLPFSPDFDITDTIDIDEPSRVMPHNDNYDHVYKIVLVGDSEVGKTHLMFMYDKGTLPKTPSSTIRFDYAIKIVPLQVGGIVKAQIWDAAGQERYRGITGAHYRRAMGALLVYDITNSDSFEHVKKWMDELRTHAEPNVVIVLVGNKLDLVEADAGARQVPTEVARSFAAENHLFFAETSAVTSHGVKAVFQKLLQEIYNATSKDRSGCTQNSEPTRAC